MNISISENTSEDLISVNNLTTRFPLNTSLFGQKKKWVHAVENVSFNIKKGRILGLVGESGSGKTTLGRSIINLVKPTSGSIFFDGKDVTKLSENDLRFLRSKMQIIFQDPYGSLNPKMTVGDSINEAYVIHNLHKKEDRKECISTLLKRVGLSPNHASRYPHEFSGGQRQRIGIARALAVEPSFLVADEPVSALDVSIRAQVINLISDLKDEFGLTVLFISHDLSVVEYLVDDIAVMYLGKIVEMGPAALVYGSPKHPYTEALLSAVPTINPGKKNNRVILKGDIPSPINPPSGCVFRTRCPIATRECSEIVPPLVLTSQNHFKACIHR